MITHTSCQCCQIFSSCTNSHDDSVEDSKAIMLKCIVNLDIHYLDYMYQCTLMCEFVHTEWDMVCIRVHSILYEYTN